MRDRDINKLTGSVIAFTMGYIIALGLIFLTICVTTWDFNISAWEEGEKSIFLMLAVFCCPAAGGVLARFTWLSAKKRDDELSYARHFRKLSDDFQKKHDARLERYRETEKEPDIREAMIYKGKYEAYYGAANALQEQI